MVNYTLGEGFGKQSEFRIRSSTGEICITSELDYEKRNVYEFPIVATDRGECCVYVFLFINNQRLHINSPSGTMHVRDANLAVTMNQ